MGFGVEHFLLVACFPRVAVQTSVTTVLSQSGRMHEFLESITIHCLVTRRSVGCRTTF